METGAITSYIDVAQVVLYAFWIFFAGLIYYLHQEDKREGYPLLSRPVRPRRGAGLPADPSAQDLHAPRRQQVSGSSRQPRRPRDQRGSLGIWLGAPLVPTGNPMVDGIGPASYALRSDEPELTAEDENRIVPLRVAHDFFIAHRDPDPVGMEVVAADGYVAGDVREVWVDRSEPAVRYLEVEISAGGANRAAADAVRPDR